MSSPDSAINKPPVDFKSVVEYIKELEQVAVDISETVQQASAEGGVNPTLLQLAIKSSRLMGQSEELNQDVNALMEVNRILEGQFKDLQQAHGKIQTLKEKQDGDYFLTSLLIRPLQKASIQSDTVEVTSLVKQYNRFKFRKWNSEIGGDLNCVYRITLRERPYLLVLNSDSMGKSSQGAGGALIIGAVLKAIVDRTQKTRAASDQYPERWLQNAFIELNNLFVTFDGYMLVTACMMLIDEQTGLIHYFNAGHPRVVLLREGQAQFAAGTPRLSSLGTPGDFVFRCDLTQLQPGDVVLVGSDGKDDLLIETDEDGNRVINEDEEIFLRCVEETAGDPAALLELLEQKWELTDDFSLATIRYTGSRIPSGLQLSADDRRYAREKMVHQTAGDFEDLLDRIQAGEVTAADCYLAMKSACQRGRFGDAAFCAEKSIQLFPENSDLLRTASACFWKADWRPTAVDLMERLRIRDPEDVNTIANLIYAHTLTGNHARARQLFEILEARTPSADLLQAMQRGMQRYGVAPGSRPQTTQSSDKLPGKSSDTSTAKVSAGRS